MLSASVPSRTGTWKEGDAILRCPHPPTHTRTLTKAHWGPVWTQNFLASVRQLERHSWRHSDFCRRQEETLRTGKGGSNSTLALPVWTSVEKAMARNNLWLLHLSWLMSTLFLLFCCSAWRSGLAKSDPVADHWLPSHKSLVWYACPNMYTLYVYVSAQAHPML